MEVPAPFDLEVLGHRNAAQLEASLYGEVKTPDHPLVGLFVQLSKRHNSMTSNAFNLVGAEDKETIRRGFEEITLPDWTIAGFAEVALSELGRL